MSRSEIDYRQLFEFAPDAILVVGSDGRYIDANPAAEQLTKYTRAEIVQMSIGDLTTPAERSVSAERFRLLQNAGRTRQDRTILCKDGTIVHVEAHAIDLGRGTYQTILRDVSERHEAEQALRRSHDAYSTLVEVCNAAVISAGPDGRITSWNPAAQQLFGYTASEVIGMPVSRLVPQRLLKPHQEGFRRCAKSGGSDQVVRTFATTARRKNGEEVPIELSLGTGSCGGDKLFTAVARDMTVHREMIEELNDALQRLQFHVQRMPLGYIVWGTDFRILEWNPAAERIFGYTRDEAIGKHAYDTIVPEEAREVVDKVWAALLNGDTSSYSQNLNLRKDGTLITCEWFNTALHDADGIVNGVASMVMDVTERELMEARLRDAQRLESLGLLAGGVAHDFNSSLMVILGNTTLLRSIKDLPRQALENIELIEEAGSRGHELIKHLLAYARTGRHNPQRVDLNAVVAEALPFVRSSLGPVHRIEENLADDLPVIRADQNQIEQVLLNLCLNAQQAMTAGGPIHVQTDKARLSRATIRNCVPFDVKPGLYVRLLVRDTGCGMDETTLSHVFDPFFTTKADGHGLGMAAVLGILRQHGGAAIIKSTPHRGTEAQVFFPVAAGPASSGKPAVTRQRPEVGKKNPKAVAMPPPAVPNPDR